MSDYSQLDNFIYDVGIPTETQPGISVLEAGIYMSGLRKLAMDEGAEEHSQEVAIGEEASMEEGAAQAQAGVPDVTGHLEGEFAVPVEQVVQLMSQIVAHKLKAQMAYLFYAQTLRDMSREGLAQLFSGLAQGDARDISYFMRRIAVLNPGGVPLPVSPMPEPLHDASKILETLVAIEQQGIVSLKHLRAMLGENPMKFTVEEMLSHEQEQLDSLWQFMPPKVPKKAKEKMASAVKLAALKLSAPQKPVPPEGATIIPEPGSEPDEVSQLRDARLQAQESLGIAQHHAKRVQQLGEQTTTLQAQLESAQAQAQMSQQQQAQSDEAAQVATQQAQQAQQMAASSEENAAQQADAKMRLAMRIQQLRQTMADLVSSDPVQEEGVGFGEEAGPGAPVTTQQQAQQEQAQQEQATAEQAQQPGGAKQQKEVAEAQRAQGQADQQAQQVQGAAA